MKKYLFIRFSIMEALWDNRVPNDRRLTNLFALFAPASRGLPSWRLGWGQSSKCKLSRTA